MAAAAQNVGAFTAEGDLAQQRQRPGRSPWMKLLYKGLRAFINLMPQAFEVNRGVNMMNLDQNDDQLVEFSKAFILARQTEEHIKYRNLGVIMSMFDKDMQPYLDIFFTRSEAEEAVGSNRLCSLHVQLRQPQRNEDIRATMGGKQICP